MAFNFLLGSPFIDLAGGRAGESRIEGLGGGGWEEGRKVGREKGRRKGVKERKRDGVNARR